MDYYLVNKQFKNFIFWYIFYCNICSKLNRVIFRVTTSAKSLRKFFLREIRFRSFKFDLRKKSRKFLFFLVPRNKGLRAGNLKDTNIFLKNSHKDNLQYMLNTCYGLLFPSIAWNISLYTVVELKKQNIKTVWFNYFGYINSSCAWWVSSHYL